MGCVLCQSSTTGSLAIAPSAAVSALSDVALDETLSDIASGRSRLAAREAQVVAEIGRRKGNTRERLWEQGPMSGADSRRTVETATGLEELPATQSALESGDLSPQNARLLARSANSRRGTDTPVDETELLPRAQEQPPDKFAKTLRAWETFHRPDAAKDRFKAQRKARQGGIWEDPDSGMHILRGEYDPVVGTRISTELAAETDRLWRAEHGKNPTRRPSTPKQRRADALAALICGTAGPRPAPPSGGDRASNATNDPEGLRSIGAPSASRQTPATTLLVIADLDTVTGQLNNGRLANGTPIPVDEIARLACEADIIPALFDTKGQPLWLGRSSRLATPAQRIAVIARDQGCIACHSTPEWCQVHHIDWWTRGGPPDVDKLCLLCSQHHHLVHEGDAEITTTDTDTGFQLQRRRSAPSGGARAA